MNMRTDIENIRWQDISRTSPQLSPWRAVGAFVLALALAAFLWAALVATVLVLL